MSKVDSRIVELKFNTSDFERGVKRTQDNMKALDSALNLDGVAKGVENVSSKFNPMGAIAFSALQRLTNGAIDFGLKIGGAITNPLIEGGRKRAMSIEQAKFQFQGLGMDVEQSMEDALYAVKGTAFGLDEAATAAAMFGASGVESGDDMQQALRGIAGVAAMSGSSYTDMANVFTKVAGQGRLMGDDLNRLGSRGINAAATLAEYFDKTGQVVGATEADVREMVTKGEIDFNTFAEAMSDAFGEHATKASETFTGALANMNAALARIGEMGWAPHLERMRKLYNSITPVIDGIAHALEPLIKGFSDLIDMNFDNLVNFIDALGFNDLTDDFTPPIIEGIMSIFDTILSIVEPIHQAWQEVFPPMAAENVAKIGDAVKNFADAIKPTEATLKNIGSTFKGLFAILGIGWEVFKALLSGIGEFFSVIFSGTGSVLNFTGSVGEMIFSFYEAIKSGDGLSTFFKALGGFIAAPIKFIFGLVGALGDFAVGIGNALSGSGEFIKTLFGIGEEAGSTTTIAERFSSAMEGLGGVGETLSGIWQGVVGVFKGIGDFLSPLFETISGMASKLFAPLKEAFSSGDLQSILDIVTTGVFAMVGKAIYDFFKSITDVSDDSGGIVDGIKEIFGGVTGSLETLQSTLKAKTLLAIAGAIALLATAIFLLSTIDGASLTTSLTGMAVMFAQMMGALAVFQKLSGAGGLISLPIVATGLILLAGAMALLSVAVKNLADLNWNELAKGLTGVIGMLGAVAGFMHILPKNPSGLIGTGLGMIALAAGLIVLSKAVESFASMTWGDLAKGMAGVAGGLLLIAGAMRLMPSKGMIVMGTGLVIVASALHILAGAVKKFSSMSWGEIGRGLTVMAGSLITIGVAMRLMPKNLIITGTGLVIVAVGVGMLADAMKGFGSISWDEIGRGLVGLAGSLVVIALAMRMMPSNMIVTAAGLVILGQALTTISGVMKTLGGMSWEEIAKSLVALAGSLIILAGALYLMTGTIAGSASLVIAAGALAILAPILVSLGGMSWEEIAKGLVMLAGSLVLIAGGLYLMTAALPGAAALIVAAGALAILAPVLLTLGGMSWGEIARGLTMLAGAFLVLGVGGALLGAVVPALLGLGAAILLLGAGAALAGVGMLSFASGLAAIVGIGAGGIAVLVSALSAIIDLIPTLMTAVARGIVGAVSALALGASDIMNSLKTLILEFIGMLSEIIPELVTFGVDMIMALLEGIAEVVPELIATGAEILTEFLKGIETVLPQLASTAEVVIETFIDSVVKLTPTITTAGIAILISFMNGLTEKMSDLTSAGIDMVVAFIEGISEGASRVAEAAIGLIVALVEGITVGIVNVVTAVGELIVAFIEALGDQAQDIVAAGFDLIVKLIEGIGEGAVGIVEAVGGIVTDFIEALEGQASKIIEAGVSLIVTLIEGIGNGATRITTAAADVIIKFIEGLGENVTGIISAGAQLIIDVMNGMETEIPRIASAALSLITTFTTELGQFTTELGAAGMQLLLDVINGITQNIEIYAPQLRIAAAELGRALVEGIAPGMFERLSSVYTAIVTIVTSVIDWFKGLFGIQSPSTITMQMGRDLIQGIINGLVEKSQELLGKVGEIARNAIERFKDPLGVTGGGGSTKTRSFGLGLLSGLASGITGGRSGLSTTITGVGSSAIGWFSNKLGIRGNSSSTTRGFGLGLMSGLGGGISGGNRGVLSTIGGTAKGAIGRFSSGLSIRGNTSSATRGYGGGLMTGLRSGVSGGNRGVLSQIARSASGAIRGFSSRLTPGSTRRSGSNLTSGVRTGISIGSGGVLSQIASTSSRAIRGFTSRLSSRSLTSSGRNLVSGLTGGIRSSWGALSGAISSIARNAINRFKSAFKIKSPSRVMMEMGEYVGEGLAIGIKDSESDIVGASDHAANSAMDSMRNALSQINSLVDENMDTSPKIRPVLDLSNLDRGYSEIAGLIPSQILSATVSRSQANSLASMSRNISGSRHDSESLRGDSSVQYVQNITSPRPLTEKDIYRNTKSLLSLRLERDTNAARNIG